MAEMTMVERVARAIAEVQLFCRYNNWTSDRVECFPIEICKHGPGDEPIVIKRFSGAEEDCVDRLHEVIRVERARAAIEAMREPTEVMKEAGYNDSGFDGYVNSFDPTIPYQAMIDAALNEEVKG